VAPILQRLSKKVSLGKKYNPMQPARRCLLYFFPAHDLHKITPGAKNNIVKIKNLPGGEKMHMGRLTEMEKLAIEEQLRAEELCAKKVQLYMSVSRDPAVQSVLQQMAEKGQRHISTLNSMLQDAGFSPAASQH
jgi:hypothetical protein